MATFCFVTVCRGRLADLRQSLARMLAQPDSTCVVVDDACPERSGDWVEAHYPGVRVVRRPDSTEFHRSAACNAGARAADAPYLGFVDADVLLDPSFAAALRPQLAPGRYHRADSVLEGIGGTFVCARADFERAGGYDEAFRGWGEEDNDLYDTLRFLGAEERRFPAALLHHLPHDDQKRVQFHPITDIRINHAVNRVYRILKWDVIRSRGQLLPLETRSTFYRKVREVVPPALLAGTDAELRVPLPNGLVPNGWSLSRTLAYRLTRDG